MDVTELCVTLRSEASTEQCNSWIKIDQQLDVTCFIISLFNAQRVSSVSTSILRSLRLICWVISWVVLIWYDVCWCYVVVWLGWCGIQMAGWSTASACHLDTTPPKSITKQNPSSYFTLLQWCWANAGTQRFKIVGMPLPGRNEYRFQDTNFST